MQYHASCAARGGVGVLLIGAPGSGKSDLLLRLLDHGYTLVADDRVEVEGGEACSPARLAGLLEVRGLGVVQLPYTASVRLALAVELAAAERMPEPALWNGLPLIRVDPRHASAPARVTAALRCVLNEITIVAGALA